MIDNDNQVFCISPWIHIHTWPNEKVYPCCLTPMDQPVGDLSTHSLEEIWNDVPMKQLRKNMINGIKSEGCRRCYAFEDSGQESMRITLNDRYAHYKDQVASTHKDGTYEKLNLVYWDFRFSNICNFKCRMCGPQLSTGWYEDTKKIYKTLPLDIPRQTNPDKLWHQIEPLFDTVEEIYFAGGEPLLMEEHYRILDRLDKLKKYDVLLRYNSNMSQLKYKAMNVLDIWPKFKTVEMYASLDGSSRKGEFIRKGQDWNKFLQNRRQMKEKCPNVRFVVNFTLTVLNSFHAMDFHKEMHETKVIENIDDFRLNFALNPEYLCMQILPGYLKDDLKEKILEYINQYLIPSGSLSVVNDFRSFIHLLYANDLSTLTNKFQDHMKTLDTVRNESCADVFPELKDILI